MPLDEKQKDRLAELRAADVERETKEQEDADTRELEARELTAMLEAKGLKKGADFEIINNRLGGVYGIRRPDTRAIRQWDTVDEKKRLTTDWQIGILKNYIEPADRQLTWAQIGAQRPGLVWQTADRFIELMSIDREGLSKK